MSKIGKKSITIPEGVKATIDGSSIVIKGAKNEVIAPVLSGIKPILENNELSFELVGGGKQARSNWGTLRALVANAVLGMIKPFEKTLILEGVGFRIAKEGNNLNLSLGFSHPIKFNAPVGINFEVEKNTVLKISGFNKETVGQTAAKIRSFKKPEPYKGKGFRYSDEVIKRKAGKKAATVVTA